MANVSEVIAQVRYQLSRLSARNAHHDFEHLCRHLARARICSNILPATGPVSAGGDQGRDFETFATHLRGSSIAGSTFAGRVSEQPIAFACSLQKKGISNKIKSDVDTICSGGVRPVAVHFFCERAVPVETRHTLQSEVKAKHTVHLEVYDGEAIAEWLSDRDVFWIAMQYLELSADIYPVPEDLPNWYASSRESADTHLSQQSWADFLTLKTALRYATFNEKAKPDLPRWINSMRRLQDSPIERIARSAVYEVAVARLRGLGSMEGEEENIRAYFSKAQMLEGYSDLRDAVCLLNYCLGAAHEGATAIRLEEVDAWRTTLKRRVATLLRGQKSSTRKCELLFVSGQITLSGGPGQNGENVSSATKDWRKLLKLVKEAPLFPLEQFADLLTVFMPVLVDHPEFVELSRISDDALANRHGQFAAAEKCRDRALALYKQGRILGAINELHRAKINWFADEMLKGSVLAMLLIADGYLRIGLAFASKQYALAVASLALHTSNDSVKRFVPIGIAAAGLADYYHGAWYSFVILMENQLLTHNAFAPSAGDIGKHQEYTTAVAHLVNLVAIAEEMNPQIGQKIRERTQEWGLDEYFEAFLPQQRERFGSCSRGDLVAQMRDELGGVAFSDSGAFRRARWKQIGIRWTAEWKNDYSTTVAAEAFLAALQVILADLAGLDLCVMRTHVELRLAVGAGDQPEVQPKLTNDGRGWLVMLPDAVGRDQEALMDLEPSTMGIIGEILLEVSVAPAQQFHETLKRRLVEGLHNKLTVGRPYAALYRDFVDQEQFDSLARDVDTPFSWEDYEPREHPELAWVGGSGPGYSKKGSEEILRRRYEGALSSVRNTLPRLVRSESFREVVRRLREEGWLDWHILNAVASTAVSFRVFRDPRARKDPDYARQLIPLFMKEESTGFPEVPSSEFSEENLRRQRITGMAATMRNLGLELRQRMPDLAAIEDFLAERYGYWVDDVEHQDPFSEDMALTK